MFTYYLLLGTNQGDRVGHLKKAMEQINTSVGKIKCSSSIYETEPWGLEEQPDFLNMVVVVETTFEPIQVLKLTKSIEQKAGAPKEVKWGPRILDIDILYCDDIVVNTDGLYIPHKQVYHRNFALIPLIEVAGDLLDPVKKITIDEIYDVCGDDKEVYIFEE